MKQVQKQPPSVESVTKEAVETNHQRRKRSIKKELERIAKEGRKKKKKNFRSVLGLNIPHKHLLSGKRHLFINGPDQACLENWDDAYRCLIREAKSCD